MRQRVCVRGKVGRGISRDKESPQKAGGGMHLGIVAHMLVPETLRQFQVSLGYRVVARLSQGIE